MRSKNCFSNWILLLTLCLLAPSVLAGRPNVLLITADDLGLQLGCYGDKLAETPNIDRLAQESVQFQTAYVSQASCSPSRSTMFTGLYPHGNGHYGLANANVGFQVHAHLLGDLLPNVLTQAGYRTGRQDPVEFDNLADVETTREIQQRLKAQLVQWQEETQDPFTDREFRQQVMDKYSQ